MECTISNKRFLCLVGRVLAFPFFLLGVGDKRKIIWSAEKTDTRQKKKEEVFKSSKNISLISKSLQYFPWDFLFVASGYKEELQLTSEKVS